MLNNDQLIYQKLGNILWSIFPKNRDEIILQGQIYGHEDFQLLTRLDLKVESIEIPSDIFLEFINLLGDLRGNEIFSKDPWTQFRVSLTDKGRFNIKFAYIPEEDSWPGLYMRGISDLTEDEAENVYFVPKEIWKERVRLKKGQ